MPGFLASTLIAFVAVVALIAAVVITLVGCLSCSALVSATDPSNCRRAA